MCDYDSYYLVMSGKLPFLFNTACKWTKPIKSVQIGVIFLDLGTEQKANGGMEKRRVPKCQNLKYKC